MNEAMTKYVYDFSEGGKDQKDLLGGKGANLCEMTNLGLPVPPGFVISTEACRAYLASDSDASTRLPEGLQEEIDEHLAALEKEMGKRLGDAEDPLLVSVRSGAKFSMPGMMETVLNIGLNDASVRGLAAVSGDERFARDSSGVASGEVRSPSMSGTAPSACIELNRMPATAAASPVTVTALTRSRHRLRAEDAGWSV